IIGRPYLTKSQFSIGAYIGSCTIVMNRGSGPVNRLLAGDANANVVAIPVSGNGASLFRNASITVSTTCIGVSSLWGCVVGSGSCGVPAAEPPLPWLNVSVDQ